MMFGLAVTGAIWLGAKFERGRKIYATTVLARQDYFIRFMSTTRTTS